MRFSKYFDLCKFKKYPIRQHDQEKVIHSSQKLKQRQQQVRQQREFNFASNLYDSQKQATRDNQCQLSQPESLRTPTLNYRSSRPQSHQPLNPYFRSQLHQQNNTSSRPQLHQQCNNFNDSTEQHFTSIRTHDSVEHRAPYVLGAKVKKKKHQKNDEKVYLSFYISIRENQI